MKNLLVTVSVATFFATPASFALEWEVDAGYEARYSTNSDQVRSDEVEQWIHTPRAAIAAIHESNVIDFEADYAGERRIYEEDEGGRFDDESVVTGSGALNWHVVRDRLIVGAEHYRTESTINARNSNSPQNRQESQRVTGRIT